LSVVRAARRPIDFLHIQNHIVNLQTTVRCAKVFGLWHSLRHWNFRGRKNRLKFCIM